MRPCECAIEPVRHSGRCAGGNSSAHSTNGATSTYTCLSGCGPCSQQPHPKKPHRILDEFPTGPAGYRRPSYRPRRSLGRNTAENSTLGYRRLGWVATNFRAQWHRRRRRVPCYRLSTIKGLMHTSWPPESYVHWSSKYILITSCYIYQDGRLTPR